MNSPVVPKLLSPLDGLAVGSPVVELAAESLDVPVALGPVLVIIGPPPGPPVLEPPALSAGVTLAPHPVATTLNPTPVSYTHLTLPTIA
ncbi:MAG: hypothetical protein KUG77_29600 [Nannocystaceae bacterium]|nr:hypothetical protein [Nannocystaceae bacterium]